MADKKEAKGKESPDVTGDGEQPEGERRFTQQELDALIRDRLARERSKYSDYDDLKDKAAKADEYEEAQKSELQKAQEAVEKAEQREKDALERANERLIRAEFIAAAAKLKASHPGDAFALADRSAIEISEGGKVSGVEEVVKQLVESGRLPTTEKPKAPNLDGGSGSGERAGDSKPLSAEEKAMAKKLGLTPEQYADGKKLVPTPEQRRAREQTKT